MSKKLSIKTNIKKPAVIAAIVSSLIILVGVGFLVYNDKNKLNLAGRDLMNIQDELNEKGIRVDYNKVCNQDIVKFGGGKKRCSVRLEGNLRSSTDNPLTKLLDIYRIVEEHNFTLISNREKFQLD